VPVHVGTVHDEPLISGFTFQQDLNRSKSSTATEAKNRLVVTDSEDEESRQPEKPKKPWIMATGDEQI
jgi:hypothetical protein